MLIHQLFSLEGKVAVAVGAGGVLAGEMARGFAGAGADVVIVDLNLDAANARVEEIRKIGRKAIACRADVRRRPSFRPLFRPRSRPSDASTSC